MSISRTVAVLAGVVVTLMLAGLIAGRTAPVPEKDRKVKTSFEALQKKLPTMVCDWFKNELDGWVEVKEVKTEIKLARFTAPSDAKITVSVSLKVPEIPFDFPHPHLSFYLHYYDGHWTTTRVDCPPKIAEAVVSLMLAIDRAGEK